MFYGRKITRDTFVVSWLTQYTFTACLIFYIYDVDVPLLSLDFVKGHYAAHSATGTPPSHGFYTVSCFLGVATLV